MVDWSVPITPAQMCGPWPWPMRRSTRSSTGLIRGQAGVIVELGADLSKVELANALWEVYQMLGKLEPRAHVLRRT